VVRMSCVVRTPARFDGIGEGLDEAGAEAVREIEGARVWSG